jgi:hypothetical protein
MIHQKYCSKYSSLLKLPPVAVLPPITHVGAALLRQYSVERLSIQAQILIAVSRSKAY